MLLYHGSPTEGIRLLEPRQADHDRPYVYMTTLETVACIYLTNTLERPYYWFPYGFERDGRLHYEEYYPNALQEATEGKSGYIYRADIPESDLQPLSSNPCARLSEKPVAISGCTYVPDCYPWLLEKERQGLLLVHRFKEKTSRQLEVFNRMLVAELKEKNMLQTPDCSYARFVRQKFPQVWEQYEQQCCPIKTAGSPL